MSKESQAQKVYSAENTLRGSHKIMPDVRQLNKKKLGVEEYKPTVFNVGVNGVIESVTIGKYKDTTLTLDDYLSDEGEEIEIGIEYEQFSYDIRAFSDIPSYKRENDGSPILYDEFKDSKKAQKVLQEAWDYMVNVSKKYEGTQYTKSICMDSVQWNKRSYKKDNRRFFVLQVYITVEVSQVVQRKTSWNKELELARSFTAEVPNPNYKTTEELETQLIKNVKNIVFRNSFYKKYFDTDITFEMPNSYKGNSYYKWWDNHIVIKKWACDKTVLHELAHQGKGCNNNHDRNFTSQMLMLVGTFMGHKAQIELEDSYRQEGVDWDGIFFHSEDCIRDCGITDEVALKRAKGKKQCATLKSTMHQNFNTRKKVASRRY